MIPYGTSRKVHTATSCGFHTRLRRDLNAESAPKPRTDSNRQIVGDDLPGVPNNSTQTGRRGRGSPERAKSSFGGSRGRRPLQIKNYLQSHRCNGFLDRFEPTKAFLREEGGTRSVTEGAFARVAYITLEMFTKLWYNKVENGVNVCLN